MLSMLGCVTLNTLIPGRYILQLLICLTLLYMLWPWNMNINENTQPPAACETTKYTVKPVLSGHSKIDETKVLKTNGSLMKVESKMLSWSILLYF